MQEEKIASDERGRIEEPLGYGEQRFGALIQNALDIVMVTDADGTIRYISPSAERVLGYDPEEMVGTNTAEYVHPGDLQGALNELGAAVSKPGVHPVAVETRVRHKDGSWRHLEGIANNLLDDPMVGGMVFNHRDVTDRVRAEAALRESEERYRLVARATNEAIWDSDLLADRQRWNGAFATMFGYPLRKETNTAWWEEHVHPGDRERVLFGIDKVLRGSGDTWSDEYRFRRADGAYATVVDRGYVVRDAGGEPVRMIGSMMDVTERRRAEARSQASEAELRALFAAMTDVIFVLDSGGRFLKVAPTNPALLYKPPEYLIGKSLGEVFPQEQAEAFLDHVRRALATRQTVNTEYSLPIGGEEIWFAGAVSPMREDAVVYVARDITERKRVEEEVRRLNEDLEERVEERTAWLKAALAEYERAEEALRQSEERYRAVIEQAGEGIFLFDPRTKRILQANLAFREMFGYSPQELERTTLYDLVPEDPEGVDRNVERALKQGHLLVGERNYRRKDGSRTDVEVSGSVISYGGKEVICSVVRDITERKWAEAEIRKLNEQLEQRVQRRTAQLKAFNRELEAFSYSVSHDLRAPLRSIDGFSQILLEDYADELDDDGKDYLGRVRAASQRMGQLIDDLLNLSRMTRGEMRRERVDLSAIAEVLAKELKRAQPERRVEFVVEGGLVVEGDGRLLGVALENLLRNAWKFTGKQPRARIEFGVTNQDGAPAYFVRDDGAGFDEAYADKLFGAFQRLHGASEFEGTGVGLATVQRIVHRHGGRVWAEGRVGHGATFYFTLPQNADVAEA